jgi:hypothetical protein
MVEFYLILAAIGKANSGMFWRLLLGSVVMLVGGYLGEAGYINATLGFIIGMAGWVYILYEIFSGEAGKAAAKSGNKALVTAFGAMRMIVTVGWAIYPLGYVFGYLTGGVDAESLNVVYNLADFVNKIAFGLVIWAAATSSSSSHSSHSGKILFRCVLRFSTEIHGSAHCQRHAGPLCKRTCHAACFRCEYVQGDHALGRFRPHGPQSRRGRLVRRI